MAYQPNPINIKVGDTLIWTNDSSSTHIVTLKDQPVTTVKGRSIEQHTLHRSILLTKEIQKDSDDV